MIAGAKVATFSLPPNIFTSFFQKFYNFPDFLGKIGGIPILYNIRGQFFSCQLSPPKTIVNFAQCPFPHKFIVNREL